MAAPGYKVTQAQKQTLDSSISVAGVLPTMAAVGGAGELVYTAAATRALAKTGVAAANVVTMTSASTVASEILVGDGSAKTAAGSTVTIADLAPKNTLLSSTTKVVAKHTAAPGVNPVEWFFGDFGAEFWCDFSGSGNSDIGVAGVGDYVGVSNGNPSGDAVYVDEDGGADAVLLHDGSNTGWTNNVYVRTFTGRAICIKYDATASSKGPALYCDDTGTPQFEFVSPTTTDADVNTSTDLSFAYKAS